MKPTIYVDLEVLAGDRDGESMSAPVLAGAALDVLHGAFRQRPGRYALALPEVSPGEAHTPGRILRVFAGGRDDRSRCAGRCDQRASDHPGLHADRLSASGAWRIPRSVDRVSSLSHPGAKIAPQTGRYAA